MATGSLEIKILAGAESKLFLADFRKQIDRLEALANKMNGGKKTAATAATEETDEEEEETEETETEETETDVTEETEETDETEEEDAPPKKSTKGKKVTAKEVKAACQEKLKRLVKARGIGADEARQWIVQKILKKNFGVTNVDKIDEADFAEALTLLSA